MKRAFLLMPRQPADLCKQEQRTRSNTNAIEDEPLRLGRCSSVSARRGDRSLDSSPSFNDFQQMLSAPRSKFQTQLTLAVGIPKALHKVPERKAREINHPLSVRGRRGAKILLPKLLKGSVSTPYIHPLTDAGWRTGIGSPLVRWPGRATMKHLERRLRHLEARMDSAGEPIIY